MQRPQRLATALVAVGMFVSGCYGPFTLTRKVYDWNGKVSDNRWVVEGVFVLCAWLPVYGLATAADAIIFNSVEFWTGKSMLSAAPADPSTQSKRLVRKDSEVVLTRLPGPTGDALLIQQYQHGQATASLRLERQGDTVVAFNADGAILLKAQMLADGRVVVTDAKGQQVASHSDEQVRRLLAMLPQR